jgi:Signal transduction histidine kinase
MPRDGYIVVIHDVSSRYELEKAQRTFVADVSHELKTPLTSIRGSIESIQLYPDMDEEFKETFLNTAIEECDRMLRIIGELLTLSKLENRKTEWQISSFDTNGFLSQICGMMLIEAESRGLELSYVKNENLPWILADKDKIKQVVINIIANSIRYSKENGSIMVAAKSNDKIVRIFIRDNGIGIPEEDIPRIFERFYRVEKSRTTDTGGTGLGLAIAKEIVEAHGGKIVIKSKIDVGTDIMIDLPIITQLESDEE